MVKPNTIPLRKAGKRDPEYRWYGHYCPIADAGIAIQEEESQDPLYLSFFIVHEVGGGPIAGITVSSQKQGERALVDLLHHPGLSDEIPFPETICVSTEEARTALKQALAGKPIAVELIPEPAYVDGILAHMREEIESSSEQSILTTGDLEEATRVKLVEASLAFGESYLWETLFDTEIFALEESGKTVAFCSVIGGGGEQVGVSIFEDPNVLLTVLRDEIELGYMPPSSFALLFETVSEEESDQSDMIPAPPEIYRFDKKGRMTEPTETDVTRLNAVLMALSQITDVEEWPIASGSAIEWVEKVGRKSVQMKFAYIGDFAEDEEAVTAAILRLAP